MATKGRATKTYEPAGHIGRGKSVLFLCNSTHEASFRNKYEICN